MRILLVDDEQILAKYIKQALEEQGYAVDLAYSGPEALGWTEVVRYDVIVLDILLPGLDGLSVCGTLRERDVRTPILMLTARDSTGDRVAGLDMGADDYLGKPFVMKELLARLRALIRRGSDYPKTPQITVADLILDPRSMEVKRGGKTIDLTVKEFAMLEFMMREQGRVLSREQIAEHVWNYEVFNQSNVIDVYMRNMRRKIDDPYPVKLIQTVRGAGYKLSPKADGDGR